MLLKPGTPTRAIARQLRSAGVIRSWPAFVLWHYWKLTPLKAGEYRFAAPADAIDVHRRLARGDVVTHTVVIPEGFNIWEIAAAIEQAGLGPRQDFLKIAQSDTALVSDLDPQASSLEGYLFPDTYQFTRTQTMREMAEAMVRRFRQEAKRIGLSGDVHRIVTVASIVEKETAAPEERATVAGVYYNRLAKKMALDADPSVIYAALLEGSYRGQVHTDLASDSPYNTYKFRGLPPGPIANPGAAALLAAMHPAQTDYLYFVSDNNGHHRFARTEAEHEHNVALYRREQAGR